MQLFFYYNTNSWLNLKHTWWQENPTKLLLYRMIREPTPYYDKWLINRKKKKSSIDPAFSCSTRNPKNCCCFIAKTYPTLLQPHGLQPARLPCPWDFPAKNGVGCHLLLQGFAQPRNQTLISCTAGRFLTTEPPEKTNQRVDDSIYKN